MTVVLCISTYHIIDISLINDVHCTITSIDFKRNMKHTGSKNSNMLQQRPLAPHSENCLAQRQSSKEISCPLKNPRHQHLICTGLVLWWVSHLTFQYYDVSIYVEVLFLCGSATHFVLLASLKSLRISLLHYVVFSGPLQGVC